MDEKTTFDNIFPCFAFYFLFAKPAFDNIGGGYFVGTFTHLTMQAIFSLKG